LLCAGVVFIALLAIYALTLIPTVVDQDSGEFVIAGHGLGIPHPTGYPLWTVLARGFDLLPLGHTSAYRIALLSACAAAAAGAVIAWLTLSLTGALLPAVCAGLAFGLWFPVWSQAVLAEVYPLEHLLFALFLLALWRWDRARSPKYLYWLALAGGFVSMHHRTAFLMAAPGLVVAVWLTRPRRVRVVAAALLLSLAPMLCYLYLPLRAAAHPAANWGNPTTLSRLLDHALGRGYTFLAFKNSFSVAMSQAVRLAGECLAGAEWPSLALALIGGPLIVWGMIAWRRRAAVMGSLVAGGAALSIWTLAWGDISDVKVFLGPLGAVLALWGGLGLARVSARWPRRKLGPLLAAGMGTAACVILLLANWGRSDRSNDWQYRDHWAAALVQMERNSIFVPEEDNAINVTSYLQHVERIRPDVTVLVPSALWTGWYADLISDGELRRTAKELWREAVAECQVHQSQGPEWGQCVAVFASRLAAHYRGRRAVYALHGPITTPLPTPPYFVAMGHGLYRLDFAFPNTVRVEKATTPLAAFSNGLQVADFAFDRTAMSTGELVGFRLRWRTQAPLTGCTVGIRLRPAGASQAAWRGLEGKAYLLQEFKPIYGLWGLAPSAPGRVYEQRGKLILPSNLPSGRYTVEMGLALSPSAYEGWTQLGDRGDLEVQARPLPSNGA